MTLTVETARNYKVRWLDDTQTILLLQIESRWTWDDAHVALETLDREIRAVDYDVYTIYHFLPGANKIPSDERIANLKKILSNELANERMIVLVGVESILFTFLSMVTGIYGYLNHNASKIRSVSTLEQAHGLIETARKSER